MSDDNSSRLVMVEVIFDDEDREVFPASTDLAVRILRSVEGPQIVIWEDAGCRCRPLLSTGDLKVVGGKVPTVLDLLGLASARQSPSGPVTAGWDR